MQRKTATKNGRFKEKLPQEKELQKKKKKMEATVSVPPSPSDIRASHLREKTYANHASQPRVFRRWLAEKFPSLLSDDERYHGVAVERLTVDVVEGFFADESNRGLLSYGTFKNRRSAINHLYCIEDEERRVIPKPAGFEGGLSRFFSRAQESMCSADSRRTRKTKLWERRSAILAID